MKVADNVTAIGIVPPRDPPPANDVPGLVMPADFRSKKLKAAWQDLIETTEADLQTRDRRFDFEMAARLMARFRAGELTNASEFKELKRLMVTLGLSKGEDGEAGKKGKLSKYVTR